MDSNTKEFIDNGHPLYGPSSTDLVHVTTTPLSIPNSSLAPGRRTPLSNVSLGAFYYPSQYPGLMNSFQCDENLPEPSSPTSLNK